MFIIRFIYKILEIPFVYNLVQSILGGKKVHTLFVSEIKKILSNISYTRLLDVGCGTGIYREAFSNEYVGIDINPQYIELCKKTILGEFSVGDATKIEFENSSFDVIATIGVIHHLDGNQTKMMFDEMKRICKPNGNILLVDGLIPGNRLNFWGYIIAKMDRGKYKKKYTDFKKMIDESFGLDYSINAYLKKSFPMEYVFMVITKNN
jgi:ubiquinone/menaquinone biosynthesis C-methylase UbiE